MGPIQRLESRAALSIAAAVISFIAISVRRIHGLPNRRFDAIAFMILPLSRIVIFMMVFFVAGVGPHGDVTDYYIPQAKAVLAGQLPYRDFYSSYGPLYGYVYAGIFLLWPSPLAFVAFAIAAECFLLPLWFRVGRLYFKEGELRTAAVLYICSPISIFLVAVDGQNSILVGVLLPLALVSLALRKPFVSGACFALNIIAIKFLPLLYLPSFLTASRQRLSWLWSVIVTIALGYSFLILKHAPIFAPFYKEGKGRTSGGLPYLIEMLSGRTIPNLALDLTTFAMLVGIVVFAAIKTNGLSRQNAVKILILSMPALTCTLLLFSKKSVPNYVLFALYPICLIVAKATKDATAGFLLFMTCATIEPGYWFALVNVAPAVVLRQPLFHLQPTVTVFFVLECIVVAGYASLMAYSIRLISAASQSD